MPGHARIEGFYYADGTRALEQIAARMRENSERWFPEMHVEGAIPPWILWSMGIASEGGEQLDETKKVLRTGSAELSDGRRTKLVAELGDVFTYLLLLADDLGIDLVSEWLRKTEFNEQRFGRA
jgi:NTP pyrophosphatase (non-canonical NTP hydrolase)